VLRKYPHFWDGLGKKEVQARSGFPVKYSK